MAILIPPLDKPGLVSPVYNPMIWSVDSNRNLEQNMSYVFDVYINKPLSATGPDFRIKQRPNPSGVGLVDVSGIVQGRCLLSDFSFGETLYFFGATGSTGAWYADSSPVASSVFLKVGEEYEDPVTGVLTMYNGVTGGTAGIGQPSVVLDSRFDGQVMAIPAALNPLTHTINSTVYDQDDTFWRIYQMQPLSSDLGKFLKTLGNTQEVYPSDYHTLGFINWYGETGPTFSRAVQLLQVKQYSATGGLLSTTDIQNTTAVGGGPQTTDTYTTLSFDPEKIILYFKCGPRDFKTNNTFGGWPDLDPQASSYTVQAFTKAAATGATAPGTPVSEIVTFKLQEECSSDIYPRVRLSWLNYLGGRDYYNFTKKYEKTTESPGQFYTQTDVNWGGTHPYINPQVPGDYNSIWTRGGRKPFNKFTETLYIVESDWIVQEEVDALAGIAESPSVWMYTDTTDIDLPYWSTYKSNVDIPILVTVNNVRYSYKNVKQQKLVQASFELTFNKLTPRQQL